MVSTIYLLEPITDQAKAWVREHVQYESYQQMGRCICVEHRYIEPIVAGMQADGLVLDEDFAVGA